MGPKRQQHGFTLVELIVVMALLATIVAISAPSLSRSMKQRFLDNEASRFLALTEYARHEAVSQGVPMIVWFDPTSVRLGVSPKTGFDGDDSRSKDFAVDPDLSYELEKAERKNGVIEVAEFSPSGAPTVASIESVIVKDRFKSEVSVQRTADRWAYEIVKEAKR